MKQKNFSFDLLWDIVNVFLLNKVYQVLQDFLIIDIIKNLGNKKEEGILSTDIFPILFNFVARVCDHIVLRKPMPSKP